MSEYVSKLWPATPRSSKSRISLALARRPGIFSSSIAILILISLLEKKTRYMYIISAQNSALSKWIVILHEKSVNFRIFFRSLKFFQKTNEKLDKFLPWNLKSGQIIWLRHTIMTLNIINSIFKLNYYKKVHSSCLFDHFLDSRTEICQIFCCFFGKFKISKRHSEINDL